MLFWPLFWIKPPIAKLWPEASCTVVSARRVTSAGTTLLLPAKAYDPSVLSSLSSLTSGLTFMLIMPLDSTVGVKPTLTPYCLYWMPTLPRPCGTGIGYSPPARKFAGSPEVVVRFGSASRVTSPSSAMASIANWPVARCDVTEPVIVLADPVLPLTLLRLLSVESAPTGNPVCRPIANEPRFWKMTFQLKPSCLETVLDTSATRTRRFTWVAPAT